MRADMLLANDTLDGPAAGKQCACIEKMHFWFVHALRRWPHAQFFAKTEDDTYVNVEQLLYDLQRPGVRDAPNLVYGLLNTCASPDLVLRTDISRMMTFNETSVLGRRGAQRASCFIGDFETMPLSGRMTRGASRKERPEGEPLRFNKQRADGCRQRSVLRPTSLSDVGPPMPFPTGPLAVLSADITRSLFAQCEYVHASMTTGRAANRRAHNCDAEHVLAPWSLTHVTCDCVWGEWLRHCTNDASLAHMTWTKGHHWAADAGGLGFVRPSTASVAIHGLKLPGTRQFEETHAATSVQHATRFPPLLWRANWSHGAAPLVKRLHPRVHEWYGRTCGGGATTRLPSSGSSGASWSGFGCHPSRGWREAMYNETR